MGPCLPSRIYFRGLWQILVAAREPWHLMKEHGQSTQFFGTLAGRGTQNVDGSTCSQTLHNGGITDLIRQL
ncbi:unnamed protein product [Calypogeia fissa]